jgi:hypothetical protein
MGRDLCFLRTLQPKMQKIRLDVYSYHHFLKKESVVEQCNILDNLADRKKKYITFGGK